MENFLSKIVLFQDLNKNQLEKINNILQKKHLEKEVNIFLENESGKTLYIILNGLVKIYKTDNKGKEKTLTLLGKEDYFGEMALLDNKVRSASAQTLRATTLLYIYKNDFMNLIKHNPNIAFKIITTLSSRLRNANKQIKELSYHDVRERLISELNKLTEKYGKKIKNGGALLLTEKITHQELANLTGTTRGTITKVLQKMKNKGFVKQENGHLIIKKLPEDN